MLGTCVYCGKPLYSPSLFWMEGHDGEVCCSRRCILGWYKAYRLKKIDEQYGKED